jgi:sugar phosphate isomerase/epimerase
MPRDPGACKVIDRRQVLIGVAAAAAIPLTCGAALKPPQPAGFRLAMTDITVRKELQADFAGTIRALRKIGYTHFGSRLRRYTPAEAEEIPAADKARILRDAGMLIGAVRFSPMQPLEPQFEEAHRLGASVVVLPAARVFLTPDFKPRTPSRQQLEEFIVELNRTGESLRATGLVFAYHNHAFDAVEVDGVRALDRMISGTDPAKVSFEIDLAWAHVAGYNPLDLVRKLGKRVVSLHLKDVDTHRGASIDEQLVGPGEGEMNYRELLPGVIALTRALPAVEIDKPTDGLAASARAFQFCRDVLQRRRT